MKNLEKCHVRRRMWSACLGNLFEHYDAALFGFLSPFLAPLIFPKHDPVVALILTYAMMPLGMIARPLGSLVFGYIGDSYGRGRALFLTLAGMAIVSLGIACTPTYETVGILAPILFCIGRLSQNFLAAGETMGGAILLLESSEDGSRDFLSGVYNASTLGGILLASAGVAVLAYLGWVESGWRALYITGSITALFGMVLRRSQSSISQKRSKVEGKGLWHYRKPLLLIAIASGFGYANYAMALVLMNGFIPLVSAWTKADMASLNTALLILDFATLPLFGWLASKTSRENMMLGAALFIIVTAIPLFSLLQGASLLGIMLVRGCFVLFGVAFFAPFHSWSQQLVPKEDRYKVISFGYAIGSQLFGGPAAALSLWFFQQTGNVKGASLYWIALALLTFFTIASTRSKKRQEVM